MAAKGCEPTWSGVVYSNDEVGSDRKSKRGEFSVGGANKRQHKGTKGKPPCSFALWSLWTQK